MTYADSDKEFVEVDVSVSVGVEESHKGISFSTGNLNLDFAKTRVELLSIDLVVAVEGIEVSEGSAETSDSLGTTGLDLVSNSLEDYVQ